MSLLVGLAEIVLWTHGMERSLRFYRDTLGLQVISPADSEKVFLSAGDGPGGLPQMIVLLPHPVVGGTFPSPKPQRVLHHLAFGADPAGYDTLEQKCRLAGLTVRQGVHPVLRDVRTFYVDDPEGNEVEIIARRV